MKKIQFLLLTGLTLLGNTNLKAQNSVDAIKALSQKKWDWM